MAKLLPQLIALLLSLSAIAIAKGVTRTKRGSVTCICITIDCTCRPSFSNQLFSQPYLPSQSNPLQSYVVPEQPISCINNCLSGCIAQAQQQCQLSCQQSCGQPIRGGQSIGGVYGTAYNEPIYLTSGPTQAPQYFPPNAVYSPLYSPSGAIVSSGAAVNEPAVCIEICMPSCSTQCLHQQQQPIPVVQQAPLPFWPTGPGPVIESFPSAPTQGPIFNVPTTQPPYIQPPTPVVSQNIGSTVCISVCMPSCNAECLQQNPNIPSYTPVPPYLPQPTYETPSPSFTPLPPYQTVTPAPIPVTQQTSTPITCIQICMPSCSAQCIDQQQSQPLPYVSSAPRPVPVVPPQSIIRQPVHVTLPQSIQTSPNCLALCQNACINQCSQQNLDISQCSSPCLSTCSQSCPISQLVAPPSPPIITTTPLPYTSIGQPIPVVQPQPFPPYSTIECQPSPGGLSKCSCPSGFTVCISVHNSNQCCRKRK